MPICPVQRGYTDLPSETTESILNSNPNLHSRWETLVSCASKSIRSDCSSSMNGWLCQKHTVNDIQRLAYNRLCQHHLHHNCRFQNKNQRERILAWNMEWRSEVIRNRNRPTFHWILLAADVRWMVSCCTQFDTTYVSEWGITRVTGKKTEQEAKKYLFGANE